VVKVIRQQVALPLHIDSIAYTLQWAALPPSKIAPSLNRIRTPV